MSAVRESLHFSADVAAWIAKSEKVPMEIAREAARISAKDMREPLGSGGNMPVKTGNLRNSLAASIVGMPRVVFAQRTFSDAASIEGVIASAQPGHTIFLGFRAPYAGKQEHVHGFVRLAAQRWKQIVDQAVQRVAGK